MFLYRSTPLGSIAAIGVTALAFFLAGCGSGADTVVDCYYNTRFKERALPVFEMYLLNASSAGGSRLDVYLHVPYSRLRFARTGALFASTYSVTFVLLDDPRVVLQTKDIERTVSAKTYDETISSRHDAFLQTLSAPPGEHILEVILTDESSGLQYRRRQHVRLRDFSGGLFSASDLLFLQRASRTEGTTSLTPAFISDLSFLRDSIGIFQELYRVKPEDTVRTELVCRVPRRSDEEVTGRYLFGRVPYDSREVPCPSKFDSVLYREDSVVPVHVGGIQQLVQFYPSVPPGVSQLVRTVMLVRGAAAETLSTVSNLLIHPPGYPRVLQRRDLTRAIAYIATEEEVDSLVAAKTPEEFQKQLAMFWSAHGGAARQRDFEARLAEANELFSTCVDGWRVPMGITYIVCGSPDAVECQGAIAEAWSYAVGNEVMTIVFRQDYRVEDAMYFRIPPFSVDEYLWQTFVDRWRRK